MNKFFTFNEIDKKLWLGIGAASLAFVIIFAVFTTSPVLIIEKVLIGIFEMFLPGYIIMKLFLDNLELTDYKVADKAMISLGLSIMVMVTLYFLTTYIRTYALNVDEDVINSNTIAIIQSLVVIGGAFGAKFYLNKKKGLM